MPDREHWKRMLPFIQAFVDGKVIEHRDGPTYKWCAGISTSYGFQDDSENYRIKPEPKLRPWKPEEVPVGAVLVGPPGDRQLILRVESGKVHTETRVIPLEASTAPCLGHLRWKWPHEKDSELKPCGKMEETP